MEKILRNEQENEETNERASERIEQKFMNEMLSKTRKIEESLFSGTTIGCSGNFLKILGIAINYILCEKKPRNIKKIQRKCAKTEISGIFPALSAGKNFSQKSDSVMF